MRVHTNTLRHRPLEVDVHGQSLASESNQMSPKRLLLHRLDYARRYSRRARTLDAWAHPASKFGRRYMPGLAQTGMTKLCGSLCASECPYFEGRRHHPCPRPLVPIASFNDLVATSSSAYTFYDECYEYHGDDYNDEDYRYY